MLSLKNSVHLIGNVGASVHIRAMPNGTKQASLSIAVHESYKNASGEKITETQWHALVALGRVARLIEQKVTKGSKIAVEGKLCMRSFTNKKGVKVSRSEIHVRELLILETKDNSG